MTICQIAQEVKNSIGFAETITYDHVHMHKVSVRWIPGLLTNFQNQNTLTAPKMNLKMLQEDKSVLQRIDYTA